MPKNETPKPASRLAKTGVRDSAAPRNQSGHEVIVDALTIKAGAITAAQLADPTEPRWYFVKFCVKTADPHGIIDAVFHPRVARLLEVRKAKGI